MSFLGRLFGTESCNGMFKYPLFMSRKKKVETLDGMINVLDKSTRKKRCDICKRKFESWMSKWSKNDFNSSICILCHKNFWHRKCKDYIRSEQNEIRKLNNKNLE